MILAKNSDMATMTKTTVEVKIGEYTYMARLDGNRVDVYRDGVLAGHSTWGGQTIDDFPENVSLDARDELSAGIRANLGKSWRAAPPAEGDDRYNALGPTAGPADGSLTDDAANQGQMGNEPDKPARQGEKEVGDGGPGFDPNTGEVGGQALKPARRAVGDGFRPPPDDHGQRR
jgi:hypothetical protein